MISLLVRVTRQVKSVLDDSFRVPLQSNYFDIDKQRFYNLPSITELLKAINFATAVHSDFFNRFPLVSLNRTWD